MPAIVMPSISTKGSPSMIMRSAKVPLSPSSALQTMYFCSALRLRHRAPLDAGREAGAAAAAQARLHDFLDDRIGAERQRPFEALAAAMGAIILERERIDDAAAREGQPRLPLEPGNVLGRAEPQRVRRRRPEARSSRLSASCRRHRAVGDAACRRLDLDHRLEPVEAARAGADDLERDLPPRRRGADARVATSSAPTAKRRGIARE